MTTAEQLRAMDARFEADSKETLRIEFRRLALISDAIERAPGFAAWISGRLALQRLAR